MTYPALEPLLRNAVARLRPGPQPSGRAELQLRFLVGSTALGLLVAVLSLPLAIAVNQRVLFWLLVGFIVGLTSLLIATRLHAPIRFLIVALYTVLFVFVVAASLTTRELDAAQLPWLLLIPLSARVLEAPRPDDPEGAPSRRWSTLAFVLAVAAGALIVLAHDLGFTFQQTFRPDPPWLAFLNGSLFLLSAFGLVVLHDLSAGATASELAHVRSLLSICAWCRKIQDEQGWVPLEHFVTRRTRQHLSHGICPSCYSVHYPETPGDG